jgi:hypothetical protein
MVKLGWVSTYVVPPILTLLRTTYDVISEDKRISRQLFGRSFCDSFMSSVTANQLLAVTEVLKAYESIPVPRYASCSGTPQVYWQSAMPCSW